MIVIFTRRIPHAEVCHSSEIDSLALNVFENQPVSTLDIKLSSYSNLKV